MFYVGKCDKVEKVGNELGKNVYYVDIEELDDYCYETDRYISLFFKPDGIHYTNVLSSRYCSKIEEYGDGSDGSYVAFVYINKEDGVDLKVLTFTLDDISADKKCIVKKLQEVKNELCTDVNVKSFYYKVYNCTTMFAIDEPMFIHNVDKSGNEWVTFIADNDNTSTWRYGVYADKQKRYETMYNKLVDVVCDVAINPLSYSVSDLKVLSDKIDIYIREGLSDSEYDIEPLKLYNVPIGSWADRLKAFNLNG